ncbi:BH0509 family protein [Bhargavaea ginsengi]|uniref:BH0509 family protein n=1 Tax=Bhargavaea ginsengi TaxID=426757 RepID=UPI003C78F32D
MSQDEREQLIDLLTLMANGYSAEYFEAMSDDELLGKFDAMIAVEMDGGVNS